jgi:microsomal dipeptidase-like Zn-dependent dipeptidase
MQCPAHTTNAGLVCGKQLLARSGPQTSLAKTCNVADTRAANVGDALGSCASTHGGWNVDNTCGDTWRNAVIGEFAGGSHTVTHDGVREEMPTFVRWPKWNDINHQLMWIDWVKRAHEGGLRVMVALAGNSITLAKVIAGNEPLDDKSAGDVQLDEMHAYAARNASFVEIAKTAADLRRIVGQDKLAIVLGLELDHLGGFGNNAPDPSADQVRAEIRRLHGKGVRYVIPIHAADNSFGGTALYEPMFLFGNLFQTGRGIDAVCSNDSDKIGMRVDRGKFEYVFKALNITEVQRFPDNCRAGIGFKNSRRLQALGRVAIDEMMSLGMIIDVDHSGHNTTQDIIDYTGGSPQTMSPLLKQVGGAYPLVTGHSDPRPVVASDKSSERSLAVEHYKALAPRGSIAGVGSDSAEAGHWMESAQMVMNLGMPIAFGSDVNGFANLPRPPWVNEPASKPSLLTAPVFACASAGTIGTTQQCIEYLDDQGNKPPGSSATFKRAKTGNRTWDYNTEGVAHFGLFPDFLKDVERRGGTEIVTHMYQGAEHFAVSWAATEAIAEKIKTLVKRPSDVPGNGLNIPKGGQYQTRPPR